MRKKEESKEKFSPSKLPFSEQNVSSFLCVSLDGLNTNTPELKQSGQPGSGAADSSSLSNSSSTFSKTCKEHQKKISLEDGNLLAPKNKASQNGFQITKQKIKRGGGAHTLGFIYQCLCRKKLKEVQMLNKNVFN